MPCSHPLVARRLSTLIAAIALTTAGTGCKEHERLAAEIAATHLEVRQLQVEAAELQDEINRLYQTTTSLRSHAAIRRGTGDLQQQMHELQKGVDTATERKKALEAELAGMRQDFESYRAKHQR
jgi:chromosome segregation ATPase